MLMAVLAACSVSFAASPAYVPRAQQLAPIPGLAELMIAKQRNGPTGPVKLAFLREFTRFETLLDIN